MDTLRRETSDSREQGLVRVKCLLEEQCELPLDLAQLASIAHCSKFHLVRAFQAAYRETPHRYQVRCRIERAKALLAETSMRVTDICFEVGFESLGTFSSRFREITGWAPSVYRARVLAQKNQPALFIPHCYIHMYKMPVDRAI